MTARVFASHHFHHHYGHVLLGADSSSEFWIDVRRSLSKHLPPCQHETRCLLPKRAWSIPRFHATDARATKSSKLNFSCTLIESIRMIACYFVFAHVPSKEAITKLTLHFNWQFKCVIRLKMRKKRELTESPDWRDRGLTWKEGAKRDTQLQQDTVDKQRRRLTIWLEVKHHYVEMQVAVWASFILCAPPLSHWSLHRLRRRTRALTARGWRTHLTNQKSSKQVNCDSLLISIQFCAVSHAASPPAQFSARRDPRVCRTDVWCRKDRRPTVRTFLLL
jgi:hypothetical protein